MSWVEIYVIAIVHVGMVAAVGYPLDYSRQPWRRSYTGRALMFKGSSLGALFALAVLGFWWPFPGYDYIYAGVVTLVVGSMFWQWWVLRRLRRDP